MRAVGSILVWLAMTASGLAVTPRLGLLGRSRLSNRHRLERSQRDVARATGIRAAP